MPKMTDLGSPKPPQMTPKSHQKVTKNRCKKRSENKTEIRPSWGRLGAILGRFVTALGVICIDFSLVFKAFRETRFFQKISLHEPSWTDLEPILDQFGAQNGSKMGPKTEPKTIKKHINF